MTDPTLPLVELRARRPMKLVAIVAAVVLLGTAGIGYQWGLAAGKAQFDKLDQAAKQRARDQLNCVAALELTPDAAKATLTQDQLRSLCPSTADSTQPVLLPSTEPTAPSDPATTAPGQPPASGSSMSTSSSPTRRTTTTGLGTTLAPSSSPEPTATSPPAPDPTSPPTTRPDDLGQLLDVLCAIPMNAGRPLCIGVAS